MKNQLYIGQSYTTLYIGSAAILLLAAFTLCCRNTANGWITCALIAAGIACFTILPYLIGSRDYMILDKEGIEVAEWKRKIRWSDIDYCTYRRDISASAVRTSVHKKLTVTLKQHGSLQTDMGLYRCSDRRLMDEIDSWSGTPLFDRQADKADRNTLYLSLLLGAAAIIALLVLLSYLLYGRV